MRPVAGSENEAKPTKIFMLQRAFSCPREMWDFAEP